jgi:hypothetical protein
MAYAEDKHDLPLDFVNDAVISHLELPVPFSRGRNPSSAAGIVFVNQFYLPVWSRRLSDSGGNSRKEGTRDMRYPSMRMGPGIPALLAALLFIVQGASPAFGSGDARAGLLDGKVFIVENGEKGKKAEGKDIYIFKDGNFRSARYEKHYRFGEGAYTAAQSGSVITFTADAASESHGSIHWEGTVRDDRMDARYTWFGRKPGWYQSAAKPAEHWARSVTGWATEDPGPPGGGSPSNFLDGKTYLVRTGERGKEEHHNDYLVFRGGWFVSSDCVEALNFRASSYSTTSLGDGIRFRAETTSPKHGTMIWEGTIRGNVLDATARWIHKRWYWTIDRVYWFKGRILE